MRLLMDECLDRRFAKELKGHYVRTVPQMAWAGIKNGKLLTLAASQFDVFLTVDRNLSYQLHLPNFDIAILILRAKTNRLADLKPLIPRILKTIPKLKKRHATFLGS